MTSVSRTPVAVNTPRRLLSRSTSNAPELLEAQLMLDDDTNRPLLDFSDMVNAVNSFQQKFKAYTEHAITTISDEKVDFDSGRVQHNNQLQTIDREIEDAKSSQRQLWDTIRQEREADSQVRSRIQALTAQRASLSQRCTEMQTEINEARAKLEARKKAKQAQRDRFKAQVDQNGPELHMLQTRTGCSILPTKVGDQMRFTFNLVNSDDWAAECFFVIDVSRPEYAVVSHAPELPPAVFEALTSELRKTRKFYTFVKQMRKALKDQVEKRRMEEREAARKA